MAITSYPFENANTTEDQYTLLFRNFADTGIVGDYDDTSFRVTTDGSGLDVQVADGYAIIRGHAVSNDAPVTLTLDAADASLARIDRIVLRLDPATDGITLVTLKGTPATTPLAPALTQTSTGVWDLPLAQVTVAAGALNILPGAIVGERTYSSMPVGVWSTSRRPIGVRVGKMGYNVTTGMVEAWNGSEWKLVGGGTKKFVVPHTFTLAGPLATPTADGDYFIPPFFTPNITGQSARLVGIRTQVHHGAANAAINFEIRRNNNELLHTGTATKTATSVTMSSVIANNSSVALLLTSTVADPKNATVTLFVEYEV